MEKENYLVATEDAGKAFYVKHQSKPVVMLNLLRFRKTANYSNLDELQPSEPLTGKEAYQLYIKHTNPFLKEIGSEVLFYGSSEAFLIGPKDEQWDAVLVVKHVSALKFIGFSQNEGYKKIAGHRTAALEDSRLLPMQDLGKL